jgi:hypothetical protein
MNEDVTITNQAFAVLCDVVGRGNAKWVVNLDSDKRQALDHLIGSGFVAAADEDSLVRYKPTDKTELLFVQLCTGVSAG